MANDADVDGNFFASVSSYDRNLLIPFTRNRAPHVGKEKEKNHLHLRNLTYQKWPHLKGVTFSKSSFRVSMLVLRGVSFSHFHPEIEFSQFHSSPP